MIGSINAVGTALLFVAAGIAGILVVLTLNGPILVRTLWTAVAVASVIAVVGAGLAGYAP